MLFVMICIIIIITVWIVCCLYDSRYIVRFLAISLIAELREVHAHPGEVLAEAVPLGDVHA